MLLQFICVSDLIGLMLLSESDLPFRGTNSTIKTIRSVVTYSLQGLIMCVLTEGI